MRLGNEFELDSDAYELTRAGQRLKLGRIPMELLLLLVEQRGRLVSRDQIAERIWGKNVFLDTDNSINAAIRKLRQTLGDDPCRPRFVQTVIGRGYRFVAAIDPADPVAAGKSASELQVGCETAIELATDRASEGVLLSAPKRHRVTVSLGAALLVALAVFLTVGAGGLHIRMFRRTAGNSHMQLQARPALAVLGFKNLSGKSEKDWISTALFEMVSADLATGQQLRVIPGENVARMEVDLSLPSASAYSSDTLAKIRDHLNCDMIVLGSYLTYGKIGADKIRVSLQVQDANTGETVMAVSEDGTEAELAELVSHSCDKLRETLRVAVSTYDANTVRTTFPTNLADCASTRKLSKLPGRGSIRG